MHYFKMLLLIIIFVIFYIQNIFSTDTKNNGGLDIVLPDIDLKIEDKKELSFAIALNDIKLPDIEVNYLPKPNFTKTIKVDLETTLPKSIDSPEKQKPVDALIIFGYGLNNMLFADFSIFVKNYNPKISIRYIRKSLENFWIDRQNVKNSSSMDDLNAEILYTYKRFNLNGDIGFFSNFVGLQDKSIFNGITKRILNLDVAPSLKFKYQNDLTFRMMNSFIFSNYDGTADAPSIFRNDFDYFLKSDIAYTQVFFDNHFFTLDLGYHFSYNRSNTNGNIGSFTGRLTDTFYNSIRAGISYSTTIIDSLLFNVSTKFVGLFKGTTFWWYLFPDMEFGYSVQDYFHCYIKGGGKLNNEVDDSWYKNQLYTIYPDQITPSYHWFAKTGVSSGLTGWFNVNTDIEFAYNMDSNLQTEDWSLSTTEENLYILTKRAPFFQLILSAGGIFTAKDIFSLEIKFSHNFLNGFFDTMSFIARDNIEAKAVWSVPKIGLDFIVEFKALLYRLDPNNIEFGNIYLLDTSIDWNWNERIGLGIKVKNILYFMQNFLNQKQYNTPNYEEEGLGFLAYIRIGF